MSVLNSYIRSQSSAPVLVELHERFSSYRVSPGRSRAEDMFAEGRTRAYEWIAAKNPPYFNTEFFEEATQALKPREIKPDTHIDVIMLEAGRMEVLAFVKSRTTNSEIKGDERETKSIVLRSIKWGVSALKRHWG